MSASDSEIESWDHDGIEKRGLTKDLCWLGKLTPAFPSAKSGCIGFASGLRIPRGVVRGSKPQRQPSWSLCQRISCTQGHVLCWAVMCNKGQAGWQSMGTIWQGWGPKLHQECTCMWWKWCAQDITLNYFQYSLYTHTYPSQRLKNVNMEITYSNVPSCKEWKFDMYVPKHILGI